MARTRELKVVVAGDVDQLTRSLKKGDDQLDKFGKKTRLTASITSKGFHGMRLAATGAIGALGGLTFAIKGAVDAASDINESLTKNQALFGSGAKVIERYAKTTATSLGISRGEALKAAGTFGGLFDAIDIGQKKSATMSKRLVTLAADLASFNNASPEEALEALRSGLSGEAEPMRKFNAFLSETRVKAEAASLGIGKTAVDTVKLKAAQESASIAQDRYNIAVQRFGASSIEARTAHVAMTNAQERAKKAAAGGTAELTEAQKVQARYSLILKDTAKAQGDFTKTKDGDANQTRILKAQYADLSSELGQKLLPAKLKVTKALNKFIGEMKSGKGAGGDFVRTLEDIRDAVEPIVKWIGRAAKNTAEFAEEHPNVTKLAASVVGLGLAVKGLRFASAATGFTDLLKTGRAVTRTLVRIFAKRGAEAGVAAGTAAAGSEGLASGAVNSLISKTGSRSGRLFGKAMGAGMIAGLVLSLPEINKQISKLLGAKKGSPTGFGEFLFKAITGGDGPGKRPPAGKGSSKLLGARSSLQPFANIASGYGLSVTSGARPGSITSSGNVSYHSSGEAIDVGNSHGPDAAKLRFFRAMKRTYGRRLAELIYTPGGMGIKDGRPYRYTGQVAKDHYDHVHVALDTGKPGVGDGLGKFVATSYGPPWTGPNGTGVTAAGVNLKGSPHMYGIAADPRVLKMGMNVRVQPNPFNYGGTFRVFDTGSDIKGNRIDFYDWRGRTAQTGWGRKTVTVSTANGGGPASRASGGSTQEAIQKSLDANQRRIDALRNQLDKAPKGIAGAVQRDKIQDQIRALTSTRRGLTSEAKAAPSAQDIQEQQERSGSRLVNRITAPFAAGIREATRGAATLGTAIEDAGTAYGQTERIFGMTDEDLGTAGGRAHRVSEIAALIALKKKTIGQQKQRAALLRTAIRKLDAELKKLRAARDKQKGAKRAKMNERIKPIIDRRDDLAAELKALGVAITDTQLDIGDLAKEAGEVAKTPDTEDTTVSDTQAKIAQAVSDIDLMERAGLITPEQANQMRVATLQAASTGRFGALDQRGLLEVLAQLGDASKAQAEAQAQAAAEVSANTQALRDLQAEVAKQNAIAGSIIGIQLAEAQRVIGDMISGQIGTRTANRSMMPGSGQLSRL